MLQISINHLSAIVDYFVNGIKVFLAIGLIQAKHALKRYDVVEVNQLQNGSFELSILISEHVLFFLGRERVPDLKVIDSFKLVYWSTALALAACFVHWFVTRVETSIWHVGPHVGVAFVLYFL